MTKDENFIDIVFNENPVTHNLIFIEVEDHKRSSIKFGEWIKRDDGYIALRIIRPSYFTDTYIKKITSLLPDTFYAGRPIEWRIKKMVEQWQRAMKINHELEQQLKTE